jgi:3'-phosphoadenosine 5'-phosphosulfate sulfotransferase (PAPS reductase)/FAD synthetase
MAKFVASVSGGKDSTSMCLHLQELGIEHERIFMDTGWEHQATYEYLRGPLTKALGPITELRGPLGMADLCRKKGMFPSRLRRFCTSELKVLPAIAYVHELLDAGHDVINAVGIRSAESRARQHLPEADWSGDFGCWVWRPILHWSVQDVIDIHARHGLAPNPLYLAGHSRVGCWPCIHANKSQLRLLAGDAERAGELRRLEREVGDAAEARGAERPFFFQANGALRSEGRVGRGVPIDDVLRWAITAHGGRQYELIHDDGEPPCMAWGLCDA